LTYEEYLASDVWKCPKAPVNKDIPLQVLNNTGAHHWKEILWTKDGWRHTGLWYCKYCSDARKYPKEFRHTQAIVRLNL